MARLNFSPREIDRALRNKLDVDFREGKELNGWFLLDGKKAIRFTIPRIHSSWGKGVISDVLRKSHLVSAEFRDLVNCPISRHESENILRDRLP